MLQDGRRVAPDDQMPLLRGLSVRSEVPSFIVMDVMRRAAEQEARGTHVIHMEVGQPSTPAPWAAREAAKRAVDQDKLGYTLALGLEPLRERIARHYRVFYGVEVAPERVVVTTGSSAAFVLAFLALFGQGERVGLPAPGYPCYRHILTTLGCEPVLVPTGPETRWMPTARAVVDLAGSTGLAGLVLASPANPTGTLLSPLRLAEIVATCLRHGTWLVSDEIYHGLTYEMPAETALKYSDDVVVINSFSKYFSMTGWRVGWMVVPSGMVRTMERLTQNLYISPPAIAQAAALGAFDAMDELEANKRLYAENRALLLQELPKAGFEKIAPADGAFYLYCDVSHFTEDSLAFAGAMLEETGVAATPGVDFDAARGSRYLRFSYAGSAADMAEAARRLQAWQRLR